MAKHKSAIKRHKQSIKRRDRNHARRAAIRTSLTKTLAAIEQGDIKLAQQLLRQTEKVIASAAGKGTLPKKTASRKISRLAAQVARASKK